MHDYIQDAIDAGGLQMTTEPLAEDRYRCIVVGQSGEMVRELRMKPGYGAPTLGQFLYYYATRVQAVEDTDDFLEWADDYGHDPADPKALSAYRDYVADIDDLKRILGVEGYDNLLTGLAIDQAITRARGSFGA